jgi:hypothetical protein
LIFSILILSLFLLSGCSGGLLTKTDYKNSLTAHYRNTPDEALKQLPRGEKGTFIKVMETTYLNLLQGKADISELEAYRDLADQRIRYKVSREIKSLFYVDMPEGYYASEHEIIMMHMLLSWGYSLQHQYERACVEARQSAHLLSAPWSEEGHFDSAMLRIWLGGLWAMCGSWEDARVDFRVAWQLEPSLVWLKDLYELDQPPQHLLLILGGVGPRPVWNPSSELNPMRGLRHLEFEYMGRKSQIVLTDKQQRTMNPHISADSQYWYQRHFERDNAIHELIEDTNYLQKALVVVSEETTKVASATILGIALGAVSVYAGYEAILAGLNVGGDAGGYLIGAGFLGGYTGVNYSGRMVRRTTRSSLRSGEHELNPSDGYRYVRYLPEYVWMGWDEQKIELPLTLTEQASNSVSSLNPVFTVSHHSHDVILAYYPDVDKNSIGKQMWQTDAEKWSDWQAHFKSELENQSGSYSWIEVASKIVMLLDGRRYKPIFPDLSSEYGFTIHNSSIEVELRTGLFQSNHVITIDLVNKSLTADKAAQKHLLKYYSEQELFNAVNEKLINSERTLVDIIRKRCQSQNYYKNNQYKCRKVQ